LQREESRGRYRSLSKRDTAQRDNIRNRGAPGDQEADGRVRRGLERTPEELDEEGSHLCGVEDDLEIGLVRDGIAGHLERKRERW
jgi:hypothetical protein